MWWVLILLAVDAISGSGPLVPREPSDDVHVYGCLELRTVTAYDGQEILVMRYRSGCDAEGPEVGLEGDEEPDLDAAPGPEPEVLPGQEVL